MNTLSSYLGKALASGKVYGNLDRTLLAIARGACLAQKAITGSQFISYSFDQSPPSGIKGWKTQSLAAIVSDIYVTELFKSGCVTAIGTEGIRELSHISAANKPAYAVQMNQLNNASVMGDENCLGSTFGIWPDDNHQQKLKPGREQIAALYILYGSNTFMALALHNSVQGFTLNPFTETFELTHPDITFTDRDTYYSVNEGHFNFYKPLVQKSIETLRRNRSLRFSGCFVCDAHRHLLHGGVFFSPEYRCYPQGKLKLMYEANPISFIVEQAGGAATSGEMRILDIEPASLHQLIPAIIGGKAAVEQINRIMTNT